MQQEGNDWAEKERFTMAIQKWDQALKLQPDSAALYELKAQVRNCREEATHFYLLHQSNLLSVA